jgi:hypothetical protein
MKTSAALFCCFIFFISYSQPVIDGNSILLKPGFSVGESKTYLVKEEVKSDEWVGAVKAENQFKVTFKVLDTIEGHSLLYTVETIRTTNKKGSLLSVIAKISHNIKLVYSIDRSGRTTHLFNLEDVRAHLLRSLDSITNVENFSDLDQALISYLREALKKPEGPEICLAPLIIFNNAFNQPLFRDRKDYTVAMRYNILNEPLIPGVEITECKTIDKANNIAKVNLNFHGDRDSAAKYNAPLFQQIYKSAFGRTFNKGNLPSQMRNDFERHYEIMLSDGWPKNIYDKSIEFYVQKVIRKISIELIEE